VEYRSARGELTADLAAPHGGILRLDWKSVAASLATRPATRGSIRRVPPLALPPDDLEIVRSRLADKGTLVRANLHPHEQTKPHFEMRPL
jgi:hypothetical protein